MNYLSPKSVGKILDIHRTTAARMMKDGTLPAFELSPGQWRCSEEALARFIRKKERHVSKFDDGESGENHGHSGEKPWTERREQRKKISASYALYALDAHQ